MTEHISLSLSFILIEHNSWCECRYSISSCVILTMPWSIWIIFRCVLFSLCHLSLKCVENLCDSFTKLSEKTQQWDTLSEANQLMMIVEYRHWNFECFERERKIKKRHLHDERFDNSGNFICFSYQLNTFFLSVSTSFLSIVWRTTLICIAHVDHARRAHEIVWVCDCEHGDY